MPQRHDGTISIAAGKGEVISGSIKGEGTSTGIQERI
jgi:hypothetical protein